MLGEPGEQLIRQRLRRFLVREVADLWFHSLVLLAWHGLKPGEWIVPVR